MRHCWNISKQFHILWFSCGGFINPYIFKMDFNLKMDSYFNSHAKSINNCMRNLRQEQVVFEILIEIENGNAKTSRQKRKNVNDPSIYLVPYKNCWYKVLEAHIETEMGHCVPRKVVVVNLILNDGFRLRGQVDLVHLQSCADGYIHWLMNYQDHNTKFLYLRPLKSKKHASNVAA